MKKTISIVLLLGLLLTVFSFAYAEESSDGTDEFITAENNDEFAALLLLKNEFDPSIKTFAEKYAGRTIEFDCNIAYMTYHGTYKTRFDILLLAGDYSETSVSGPYFQFNDVSITLDLNLTGDNIPDYLGIGNNLHVIALVDRFDANTGLFYLEPIMTMVR